MRALLPVTALFLAGNGSLSAVLIAFGVRRLGGSEHTGYLLFALGAGVLLSGPALRALLPRVRVHHLLAVCLTGDAAARRPGCLALRSWPARSRWARPR